LLSASVRSRIEAPTRIKDGGFRQEDRRRADPHHHGRRSRCGDCFANLPAATRFRRKLKNIVSQGFAGFPSPYCAGNAELAVKGSGTRGKKLRSCLFADDASAIKLFRTPIVYG
jgi:hypothetical protein